MGAGVAGDSLITIHGDRGRSDCGSDIANLVQGPSMPGWPGDWSGETEPPLGLPTRLQQQQPAQISGLESPADETYWAERSCPVPDHESSETSVKQSPRRDDDDGISKMQHKIPP